MKIGIVSDLHAEFWGGQLFATIGAQIQHQLAEADLILLAGDINNATDAIHTAARLFPTQPVCLVAGNHEFYQRSYEPTLAAMATAAAGTTNITFLNRSSYHTTIDGRALRVLGATLWTDFDLFANPALGQLNARALNDFRLIRCDSDNHLLRPQETLDWHKQDLAWFEATMAERFAGLTIVMTHHAPVSFALSPKYVNDALSPCFASRLEHLFTRDDVQLVVWGHTHHSVDRTLDRTRFVSSQVGYPLSMLGQTETNEFGRVLTL